MILPNAKKALKLDRALREAAKFPARALAEVGGTTFNLSRENTPSCVIVEWSVMVVGFGVWFRWNGLQGLIYQ